MEVLGWRSDAELVDGIRRGEDFAFGRLFERWFGRVFGVAQDILGDPQAAAEVATDTFHALWYHLDRLEDAEGFGAWAVETSRTFARERQAAPADREETAPVPLLATAPDAAAAVAVALVARGLPSAAGLADGLHGAAGATIGASAAGAAGPAPAPAGFAGAVPAGPSPAGFAGGTALAPPQAPVGFAGGAPGSGFAGTPGSGSILGGSAGPAAEMATQGLPSLGAFGPPDDTSMERVHRYEPPPRAGLLQSPQVLAGLAAAVILVVIGALALLSRSGGNETAAEDVTTTVPPAAPSVSEATSVPATAGTSTTATTAASTTAESSTATSTAATSTTRRATTSTTSTAGTPSTTTASTAATTATTAPTTSSSQPTTSTTSVTRTTPTDSTSSSSSSSSSTIPKPVITSFTLVANPKLACDSPAANLQGYTATWSASDATASALTIGTEAPIRVAAGKGSRSFCALRGTAVQVAVSGPGGKDSDTKNTP